MVLTDIIFISLESFMLYFIVEKFGSFTDIPFIGKGSIAVSISYFILLIFFFTTPEYGTPFILLSGLEHYSKTVLDILKIFTILAFETFVLDLQAGRPFYLFALPSSLLLRLISRKILKSFYVNRVKEIPVYIFSDKQFISKYMSGFFGNIQLSAEINFRLVGDDVGKYLNSLVLLHGNRDYSREHSQYVMHLVGNGINLGYLDSYSRVKGRIGLRIVLGSLVIVMKEPSHVKREMKIAKRVFDLLSSSVLALVLIPFFMITFLIYKSRITGPFFYSQLRVGEGGQEFRIFKIRTLKNSRDITELDYSQTNGWFPKPSEDQLVPMGKWMRRWSIDEFPQLLNVIRGDMSVVGPRPRLPDEENTHGYKLRLSVKPGLTGIWQISGRNMVSPDEAEELDEYYIEHWNFLMDIQICIKTIGAIRSGIGAL